MVEDETQKNDTPEKVEGVVDNSSVKSMANRAIEATERFEKATKDREKLIEREEALFARKLLVGKTEAGEAPKQKTQEEIDQEEAEKILAYED